MKSEYNQGGMQKRSGSVKEGHFRRKWGLVEKSEELPTVPESSENLFGWKKIKI